MKKLVLTFVLLSSYCFAQSINNYKAVMIPLKYDFLKKDNEYRLATMTKQYLQKAGFVAFYNNEVIPVEFNERCSFLTVDVKKESGFFITKLYVVFKDCYGQTLFQSSVGKSKEKEYEAAYAEALIEAFQSVYSLNYKYNNTAPTKTVVEPSPKSTIAPVVAQPALNSPIVIEKAASDLLYAQGTASGYQLVDASPKVVFKLYKTSRSDLYIATRESLQGVLIQKENQWFFEYYWNEKWMTEKIAVKF